MPTALGFTGQRLDAGVGLLYYRARYYDPALGRFAQPDTVVPSPGDPQQLNKFSYALNNPMRYSDPTGHWIFENDPSEIKEYSAAHFQAPLSNIANSGGYSYGDDNSAATGIAGSRHWAEDVRNSQADNRSNETAYGVRGRDVYAPENCTIIAINVESGNTIFTWTLASFDRM